MARAAAIESTPLPHLTYTQVSLTDIFRHPRDLRDLPLSAEPAFVSTNVANTYNAGDRTLRDAYGQPQDFPVYSPPCSSPTNETLRQSMQQSNSGSKQPRFLQRKPTWAQVAACAPTQHLPPDYAGRVRQSAFSLAIRPGPAPQSSSLAPGLVSLRCDHPNCGKVCDSHGALK